MTIAKSNLAVPASRKGQAAAIVLGTAFSFPTKLLRVQTGYFTAGAVWEKVNGLWSCTHAAPILRWMKGKTTDQAAIALLKMGAVYEWIDCEIHSNKIRNPAIFAGVSVTRDGVIPPPDDATYEERHQRQTNTTARFGSQESKLTHPSNRHTGAHPVRRGHKLTESNGTPRNRRGFYSRH